MTQISLTQSDLEGALERLFTSRNAKNLHSRDEKKARADVMELLAPVLSEYADTPVDSYRFGSMSVSVSARETRTLSRELLLEHGVTLDTLEACTKTSKSTVITPRNESAEPDPDAE